MNKLINVNLGEENYSKLSEIKNPFLSECITEITMYAWKSDFSGKVSVRGSVSFKNGNTSGKQEFTANSLPDLFFKIIEFCKNLEK